MKSKILIIFILSNLTILGQSVHIVPDDYSTIQEALNVCGEGDTVLVRSGTHTTNVIWPRVNDIALTSESGPENTTLDGGVNQRIITFLESTDSISAYIIGFKFTNGKDEANNAGNAIYLYNVNLNIEECIFENYIRENENPGDSDTIIFIDYLCNVIINNSIIQNNKMHLFYVASRLAINNSIIRKNTGFWVLGGSDINSEFTINASSVYENIFDHPILQFIQFEKGKVNIINSDIFNNKVEPFHELIMPETILFEQTQGSGILLINSNFVNNIYSLDLDLGQAGYRDFISLSDSKINVQDCNFSSNVIAASVQQPDEVQFSLIHSTVILAPLPVVIKNSTFVKNPCIAITTDQPNSQIENSLFEENNIAAFVKSPITVNNNSFVNNIHGIKNHVSTSFIDAKNNYWGSETGPQNDYENPNGTGDSTDYFVNVLPYLTTPSLDTPPVSVENLELVENNHTSLKLSWDERFPELISQYEIYYDTSKQYPFDNVITIDNQQEIEVENLIENETYYFAVRPINSNGIKGWLSDVLEVDLSVITNLQEDESLVNTYELEQNYPNPFNPSTTIAYQIKDAGDIKIKVFDTLGREVATILEGFKQAGKYEVEFNAKGLASGIYFYKIESGNFVDIKKMMLLK